MKKKMYKVAAVYKLLDATHEELRDRIGEQDNSEWYVWAESEEDAIGQCMANALNTQAIIKTLSIFENKLTFTAEYRVSWNKPDISVNTTEVIYTATPI